KKEKIIRLKNLTKKFGNFIAVKNLSFEIERGEIFALLGPNGAGKTTTLKMLLGIISPTEGEIEILGEKLSKENIRKIRKNIGYLSQKFSLYPDLTLYQNLKFYSGLYEVQKEKERIEELIELLNMGNWRNNLASELPLGVKQRLSLACAIINNPPLLFLDEPTSGMGVETRKEFWEILSNLKEKETTMILTTHYMDEAEYCDRILLIDKGENKALDSPFNLKKKFLEEYKIYEIKVEKIWEFENLIEKEEEVIFTRTKNGFKIFSRKEEKILEIVKKLEESGIKIINFEKSEPDLEEVFYAKVLS
ncbi:MAG: ABC transporter ATP-binding protein, partial [candidate division WOR-3 bacterium]